MSHSYLYFAFPSRFEKETYNILINKTMHLSLKNFVSIARNEESFLFTRHRLQAFSQGSVPFREPIALPELIEDTAEVLFKHSHISYTISAADDLLPLEADPRQIRQLFDNLLTNAKDAMPDGGTVNVDIENCEVDAKKGLSLRTGLYICISIQDCGSGITDVNLPKIFDPYFSTKDIYSQRGLGLGLSICQAIMKRHNGQISVESTVGIGTRVTWRKHRLYPR